MPVSSDLIERMHYKRRSSFVQEQRFKQASEPLEEVEVDIAEGPTVSSPRRKSASVCVAMITIKPEMNTVNYQRPHQNTVPRKVGTSRFIVERNCQPFNVQELQSVRLRGLSTSEVFHEPPKMYVYRERPTPYVHRNPRKKKTFMEFVKKRKHTICAWSFGIFALALMATIIALQSKGDFS
ncbi:unnamed protein product [Cylicocyclus nassatus]|uniref:Uncharacterized protein n=1 Tax=Cylicocyclus nassatus TaxID=53992 RepID=A0AA36DP93_CYLNA|nr:unnamed protein product [Cylicocyclus nassatus]